MPVPYFIDLRVERAEEFLAAISPRGRYFGEEYGWIFRGVGDSRFRLVPSALRSPSPLDGLVGTPITTNREQVAAEVRILEFFFRLADEAGLPLPEDSQRLRAMLDSLTDAAGGDLPNQAIHAWPPSELWSLMGLAQHYGVPTRLQDWSRNSYVAAYFAASHCARALASAQPPSEFTVWGFSRVQYYGLRATFPIPDVSLVSAPGAGNANLRAQQGVFTLIGPMNLRPNDSVDRRAFDELVLGHEVEWDPGKPIRSLAKFSLPAQEAGRVLRLLSKEGIGAAELFPGYGGVAAAIFERRYWRH